MAAYFKKPYEDFEPFCQWQRGQERDILEVHLQGFKRENLRVQTNSYGILTISGEQALEDSKISRFRKEIKVSKDFGVHQIHAKFSRGILYITLPKVSAQSSAPHDSVKSHSRAENTGPTSCGPESIQKTTSRTRDGLLRIEISTKMAVAVSVALLVAFGIAVVGFLIWKCTTIPDPTIY